MASNGPNIRGSNPVWSYVDLTGKQFDDTFYMWVLEDTIPYIPAVIWHDAAGTLPWTSPIQFLANGTLPIDIYWDPTQFYRLEFRQNVGPLPPSQSDPLIYLVPDYNPGNASATPIGGDGFTTENLISNPQFSNMNFSNQYTLSSVTNPASIEIGPGWFLDLSGTGTVVIERIPLNTALSNPTNAPYALHINLSTGSWTSAVLRQRFQQNGQNWQNKNLSTSITGMIVGSSAPILVRLDASNGQPLASILNTFITNTFTELSGFAPVGTYANLDLPPNAFIDYKVFLPSNGNVYLTSFQLIASDVAAAFSYEQITVDREIDHLFHYYQPKIEYMPNPNYLVGWDFPLNPAQLNGATMAAQGIANQGYYTWDQTIIYQTSAASVNTARATNGGFQMTCAVAGQVAVIQYLDQTQARKILSDRASVHMSLSGSGAAANLPGNVTLWATTDANLPALPATFITTISPTGIPLTLSSVNWVQVPNIYQNTAFITPGVSSTNAESNDINLNGWDLAGAAPANTATYFAIVVGFSAINIADVILINSISLCPGDIATRPAPQTQGEVLKECERYYEKSYASATFATAGVFPVNTTYNQLTATMNATFDAAGLNQNILERAFGFSFRTLKRAPTTQTFPTVTMYSPVTGNANVVSGTLSGGTTIVADRAIARWSTPSIGDKNVSFATTSQGATGSTVATINAATPVVTYINYHYVADARLGVVN